MNRKLNNSLEEVISHANAHGFIFSSSKIYGGLSAVYDYGQVGTELKNNIREYWWKSMTMLEGNIVGIDTAIFMHPDTWKASGHLITANHQMFSTEMGSIATDANTIYLRPEVRQGIAVTFPAVLKTGRMKIPFGIAQSGKVFRNEDDIFQFTFRMREFEQMEMHFFVKPGEEQQWYEYWKRRRLQWHLGLGLGENNYQFFERQYAVRRIGCDIQFNFPMGWEKLEAIQSHKDIDLENHERYSRKKLQYFDMDDDRNYVPYVVGTTVGLDRLFLAVLANTYRREKIKDADERVVLYLPAPVAPYKVAILPLNSETDLREKAQEIMGELKFELRCYYEEGGEVEQRYRDQDAIGTPYCITIDYQTLSDNKVILRDRNTLILERIPVPEIKKKLLKVCSMQTLLRKLQKENNF